MLIAVLLLSLNLASRWKWWVKGGAIVITVAFFYQSYLSLNAVLGYPTAQDLPSRFQIHWMILNEPDKRTRDRGAVFMWISELDSRDRPSGPPRAYRLPYSDRLHQAADLATRENGENGAELMGTTGWVGDQREGQRTDVVEPAGTIRIQGMPFKEPQAKDVDPPK
ncbi:MAG: hypothetical protein EXQ89_05095 [Rhodospirillaceae bacterium]|nr:hypothetical protein [Rhodospirillaceae bacterium]